MLDRQELLGLKRLRDIGRVASLDYQVRECLSGTGKHHVLIDELIETTAYAAEHDASHPILSRKWTSEQKQALVTFAKEASELFDDIEWQNPGVPLDSIIHSRAMRLIRESADRCLRRIGVSFTLEELLREERAGT
jgi:hypothetical protein